MSKMGVGILGATGLVGQHYLHLLQNHPHFEVTFVAASPQSSGKTLEEALAGRAHLPLGPSQTLRLHSLEQIDAALRCCRLIFSALPTEIAREWEPRYASSGLALISNASPERLAPDVPLLIPEVNASHLEVLPLQQKKRGWSRGFIVAKPNCSLQSYAIALAPLHERFSLRKVMVTTLQAASGAGYPGIASLDLIDNAIPYIQGEEEKLEREPCKIFGKVSPEGIASNAEIAISAHCNRIAVRDGHLACVSVEFATKPALADILALWAAFRPLPQQLGLPSAPCPPIIYCPEEDRPQPRRDRERGGRTAAGMAISIGRLRPCPLFHVRFVCLSHNTLRGGAGGGILTAELLRSQGYLL